MQVETGGEKMTSLPLGHLLEEVLGHEMPAFSSKSTGLLPAGWGRRTRREKARLRMPKTTWRKARRCTMWVRPNYVPSRSLKTGKGMKSIRF